MTFNNRESRPIRIIGHTVLALLSVFAIAPFVLLIMASFTDEATAIVNGYQFWPAKFSTEAYRYILREMGQIGRAYGVTAVVTLIGTFLSVFLTSMFAYGLMHRELRGMRIITVIVLITMLFNGGIVPTYYVYSQILHVKNTIWGLILPNLLMNGFNILLVVSFYRQNVPLELLEAAEIDGANQFTVFFRIVLPLAGPILTATGLLTAVSYWNDWTNGLYYISESQLYSIQQLLYKMSENVKFMASQSSNLAGMQLSALPSATIRMAIAVVAIVPIIVAYPFFHKYFAKGITIGAVKG